MRCGCNTSIKASDFPSWHITTFRRAAEFSRYWRAADIEQAVPLKFDL
jgi:hypothetical protein